MVLLNQVMETMKKKKAEDLLTEDQNAQEKFCESTVATSICPECHHC